MASSSISPATGPPVATTTTNMYMSTECLYGSLPLHTLRKIAELRGCILDIGNVNDSKLLLKYIVEHPLPELEMIRSRTASEMEKEKALEDFEKDVVTKFLDYCKQTHTGTWSPAFIMQEQQREQLAAASLTMSYLQENRKLQQGKNEGKVEEVHGDEVSGTGQIQSSKTKSPSQRPRKKAKVSQKAPIERNSEEDEEEASYIEMNEKGGKVKEKDVYRNLVGRLAASKVGDTWILTIIKSYLKRKNAFAVEDYDELMDNKWVGNVPVDKVLPLPTEFVMDPFRKGSQVLAKFPATTSFYPAEVVNISCNEDDEIIEYGLKFEDDEVINGVTAIRECLSE